MDRDLDLRRVREGVGGDGEKLLEPSFSRFFARVGDREVEINRAVPRLGLGKLGVELREACVRHMAEEALEPLMAARLDERRDQKEVEALLRLALPPARRPELRDVEIAPGREHRRAETARLARNLAEVAQLLGGERRELVDERRVSRVRSEKRRVGKECRSR